ncbi:hypothetical protein BC936DRAFT_148984, partial [Jimgerdemannia flammicorona]
LTYARANVARNGLGDQIHLFLNKDPEKVLPLDEVEGLDAGARYTFCMCNPPFYESLEQLEESANNKELPPSAVCTGTENEMITPGGEFQFIMRIVQESMVLRERVRWYTSTIGRRETLDKLVTELKTLKIDNYVVTDFCQGRTRRWGIGWSFGDHRPPSYKTTSSAPIYKKLKRLAPPTTVFRLRLSYPSTAVQRALCALFDALGARAEWDDGKAEFIGRVVRNTWSRAARRKKLEQEEEKGGDREALFEFRCQILETGRKDDADGIAEKEEGGEGTEVVMMWTVGKDREVFMGFWSHIMKKLEERLVVEGGEEAKSTRT